MNKYKVLVRGENFLINIDGENQRLGFYTTAFVEGQDEAQAEQRAIGLLRADKEFRQIVLNEESDAPVMFADEIHELESFEGLNLPRTGFSFFGEEAIAVGAGTGIANLNFHEEQFAHSFIVPDKRARYLSLLESKRGRNKLLQGFYHCRDLDSRFAKPIPTGQQSAEAIERLLKSKGAPDICHVMSADSSLDNREMSLTEALRETVGGDGGTLISCIAGKLAYFELEPLDGRYILKR